jgi:hypothetical protein|tara:strand:- start:5942 stop:7003 length:1062 start_codon:yes stop_codon:yes gene_type:complete
MANPGVFSGFSSGNAGTPKGEAYSSSVHKFLGESGMNYIPSLYAGQLLIKFYETSVLGAIANTDYEGEVRNQGDSVIIRKIPDIDINSYEKGQQLDFQYPQADSVTLNINKGKYYAFVADDVDIAQTDIKSFINEFTSDAAYQLRNTIEQDVLGGVIAGPATANKGNSAGVSSGNIELGTSTNPIQLTTSTIIDKIIECGQVLDEQNVPEEGRYFLLPPRVISMLKQSTDLKAANLTGDAVSPIRNGQVGMIDRFTIYSTNNLATNASVTDENEPDPAPPSTESDNVNATNVSNMLFGHKAAITFASQMIKSESMVNPHGFGQLYRGLQVYGYQVVKPEAFGNLYAYTTFTSS